MGLVPDVFDMDILEGLNGPSAVGHVRYSTTGSSVVANAQPLVVRHRNRAYAVAHNGNLVNAHHVKAELEDTGSIFQTTMDSEVFLHLFVRNLQLGFEEALKASVARLKGAFSMVVLTSRGELIGIKDPHGFRPLCLGKLNGSWLLASETCALDLVQAEFVRELDPGEIVIISKDGVKSIHTNTPKRGRSAFSSSSISPDRTAPFSATTSTLPARPMAGGWQRKPRWMQTWSCLFPIRAPMRRWGIRKHPASLSRRA
jgi:amidophosphoribosyltransferase